MINVEAFKESGRKMQKSRKRQSRNEKNKTTKDEHNPSQKSMTKWGGGGGVFLKSINGIQKIDLFG